MQPLLCVLGTSKQKNVTWQKFENIARLTEEALAPKRGGGATAAINFSSLLADARTHADIVLWIYLFLTVPFSPKMRTHRKMKRCGCHMKTHCGQQTGDNNVAAAFLLKVAKKN